MDVLLRLIQDIPESLPYLKNTQPDKLGVPLRPQIGSCPWMTPTASFPARADENGALARSSGASCHDKPEAKAVVSSPWNA